MGRKNSKGYSLVQNARIFFFVVNKLLRKKKSHETESKGSEKIDQQGSVSCLEREAALRPTQ